MIDQREIEQQSVELDVHTTDVQRDYVFGWLLAGIYSESDLGKQLVLKGGNCLRKAYFPYGRFSSDLDFSASSEIPPDYLATELNRVCAFVSKHAGIDFDMSRTLARHKRQADDSISIVEARLYFRDFYGNESTMIISVRLDITEFDRLYLPVQVRRLIHDYSDQQSCSADVRCVKLEEQLASKMKCLLQRRHVADLFDLVFASIIHPDFAVNRAEVVQTFLQRTVFGRSPGVAKSLLLDLPLTVFQGLWDKYVSCPIRSRIDFSQVRPAIEGLIAAVFGNVQAFAHQTQFFPSKFRNPIMEAGHTLTLLDVTYNGKQRTIEPYSLNYKVRKDGAGREYFFVYDRTEGGSGPGIKALVVDGIERMANTNETFEPRFPVELTKAGEVHGSLYFQSKGGRGATLLNRGPKPTRTKRRRVAGGSSSLYKVCCSVCGKRFRRDRMTTKLNPHKDKYGNRCIGRIGYFV